jgi:hypothetical protein
LNKQESIIIPYFENNADPAAVVRFQVWGDIWNCETILVKMVCRLSKFVKK